MRPGLLCLIIFSAIFSSELWAQMVGEEKEQEQKSMYKLVLDDFFSTGLVDVTTAFGVIDSTCPAVYYGGFQDSINKKYFGFDANNYIDGELFRRNFVDATKVSALLSLDFISEKGLIRIRKENYRQCFTSPKQTRIVLTEKGFEKLKKLYQTIEYCEFSLPYYVNEHTVLIYFNYQDGPENDFSNVFLIIKMGHEWVIGARLRSWI